MQNTLTDSLAALEKSATSGPQLSGSEWVEYARLEKRISQARANLHLAKKRGDETKAASAERALTNAHVALKDFLSPKVDHLWAPMRIIAKFEQPWVGPGVSGFHVHECEMVLERKDLSGPCYRTVRVLKDENGPPTNARTAPQSMGVAWFAIADQLKRGRIVLLKF